MSLWCSRRRQVHLLAARLPGGWAPGLPGSGQGEGDGDPLLPRPGRRGEDLQVVSAVAQQVRREGRREGGRKGGGGVKIKY